MQDSNDELLNTIRHRHYHLRPITDRQSRIPVPTPPVSLTQGITNTSSNNSNTNPINKFQFRNMAQAAIIMQATRFCGKVESSNPDKSRLQSYSVNQWLADADSRISTNRITDERTKINEALLLVSSEKGDAHRTLNSVRFNNITTYAEFKRICLSVWEPVSQSDALYKINKFLNHHYDGESIANLHTDIEKASHKVIEVLRKTNITIGGKNDFGDTETDLVSLRHVLNYLSFGTMYNTLGEKEKKAFKKVKIDPKSDSLTALIAMRQEIQRKEIDFSKEFVGATETLNERKGRNTNESYRGNNIYKNYSGQVGNRQTSFQRNYAQNTRRKWNPNQKGRQNASRNGQFHGPLMRYHTSQYPNMNNSKPENYAAQGARPKITRENCGLQKDRGFN
ncbi:uncharacterized protein [Macrobrachium rosenbergii]|uniref:uncharacterized protein n=1 Tax=Macrobrachium rosenbergii TaxID=79674 RepID=UPI0034D4723B